MPPRGPVSSRARMNVSTATRKARLPTAKRAMMSVMPPLTPPSSRRLKGMPMKPFSSRRSTCDLMSAAITASLSPEQKQPAHLTGCFCGGVGERARLRERDEAGDGGRGDDEEQAHDHLVGGARVVLLPLPDDWPRGAHVHQAQSNKPEEGGHGSDDLRDSLRFGKPLFESLADRHDEILHMWMVDECARCGVGVARSDALLLLDMWGLVATAPPRSSDN